MDGTVNDARRDDGRPARCAIGCARACACTVATGAAAAAITGFADTAGSAFVVGLGLAAVTGSDRAGLDSTGATGFAGAGLLFVGAGWVGRFALLVLLAGRATTLAGAFLDAGLETALATGFFATPFVGAALVAVLAAFGLAIGASLDGCFTIAGLAFTGLTPRSQVLRMCDAVPIVPCGHGRNRCSGTGAAQGRPGYWPLVSLFRRASVQAYQAGSVHLPGPEVNKPANGGGQGCCQTRHCSRPCRKMSRGNSMPMKTILLRRCSSACHAGPRSLPIS